MVGDRDKTDIGGMVQCCWRIRLTHSLTHSLTDLIGARDSGRLQPDDGVERYLHVGTLAAVQPGVEGQNDAEDALMRDEKQRLSAPQRTGQPLHSTA